MLAPRFERARQSDLRFLQRLQKSTFFRRTQPWSSICKSNMVARLPRTYIAVMTDGRVLRLSPSNPRGHAMETLVRAARERERESRPNVSPFATANESPNRMIIAFAPCYDASARKKGKKKEERPSYGSAVHVRAPRRCVRARRWTRTRAKPSRRLTSAAARQKIGPRVNGFPGRIPRPSMKS